MRQPTSFVIFVLAISVAGCSASDDLQCAEQSQLGFNGASPDGIIALNGMITLNGIIAHNGIIIHNGTSLADVPLDDVDLGAMECGSDGALDIVRYVVECALTTDQEVVVRAGDREERMRGAIGLAPAWADEACDAACRGWISACLIARSNARGEHVEISLRGDHSALAVSSSEAAAFPVAEATYYGSVFADPLHMAACLPPDANELVRVCGDSVDCAVEVSGRCSDVCNDDGCVDRIGRRHAHAIDVFVQREL